MKKCSLFLHWRNYPFTISVQGGGDPGLSHMMQEMVNIMDNSPICCRDNKERQRAIHPHIHTSDKFRISSQTNMNVFGLCNEARVPRENPSRHRENMQTPPRKAMGSNSSCCDLWMCTISQPDDWSQLILVNWCPMPINCCPKCYVAICN